MYSYYDWSLHEVVAHIIDKQEMKHRFDIVHVENMSAAFAAINYKMPILFYQPNNNILLTLITKINFTDKRHIIKKTIYSANDIVLIHHPIIRTEIKILNVPQSVRDLNIGVEG